MLVSHVSKGMLGCITNVNRKEYNVTVKIFDSCHQLYYLIKCLQEQNKGTNGIRHTFL